MRIVSPRAPVTVSASRIAVVMVSRLGILGSPEAGGVERETGSGAPAPRSEAGADEVQEEAQRVERCGLRGGDAREAGVEIAGEIRADPAGEVPHEAGAAELGERPG